MDEQPAYVTVFIDKLTLLSDVKDMNSQGELRLFVIVADNYGHSAGMFCPTGDPYPVVKGTVIDDPCFTGMFFKEDALGDVVHVLILAVDEDSITLGGELAYEGIINGLAEGVTAIALTGEAATGLAGFGVSILIGFVSEIIKNWIEQADIYGTLKINLLRSMGWGDGKKITVRTEDNSLEVEYTVALSSTKPNGNEVFLGNVSPASPPQILINNSTSSPSLNNNDVTSWYDDKFLYVHRVDGAESKFGPFGRGVYEIGSNGNFMVYCTEDGKVFAGRIGEQTVKPLGEIKTFKLIEADGVPRLILQIDYREGSDSYHVTVHEKSEGDSMEFPIPPHVTRD